MKKPTTKQLAIAFIAIAFAFIFGFTAYRGITGQFDSRPAVTTQVKKSAHVKKSKNKQSTSKTKGVESTQQQKENKSTQEETTPKQDTTQKETQSQKKDQENTQSKKTQTASQTPSQTTPKKESVSSSHQETKTPSPTQSSQTTTPVKKTISIQVLGINTTMMSGNIEVDDSSTAYSVLRQLARQNGKAITTKGFGSTVYVSGIDGLKEFDHGPSSGWMYKVNGTPPNIGAGAYHVKAGDTVIWYYVNVEK